MPFPSVNGKSRLRLALVRGPFANAVERTAFEHLTDSFEVRSVQSWKAPVTQGIESRIARCLGSFLDGIPKVRRVYRDLLQRLLGDAYLLLGLERALAGADIVDVPETFNYMSYQAALHCRNAGIPLVVTVYENGPFHREENARALRIKKVVRETAGAFIAKTNQIRETLLAEGVAESRIRVIPTPVNTGFFRPMSPDRSLRERWKLSGASRVVLFAGKLLWEKGVSDLLPAFKSLFVREPVFGAEWKLLIAGSGKQERFLKRLTASLGIERQVVFAGAVPFEQMPSLYNLASVVVVPSKPYWDGAEQEARVIREAMACGRAVIVTACGGSAEMVGDAGVVVHAGDQPAIANAIRRICTDDALRERLEVSARESAVRLLQDSVAGLKDLYSELLSGSGAYRGTEFARGGGIR